LVTQLPAKPLVQLLLTGLALLEPWALEERQASAERRVLIEPAPEEPLPEV
jgi:hypothetical protein